MKELRVHHLAAIVQEYLVVEDPHLILLLALVAVLAIVAYRQAHIEPEVALVIVAILLVTPILLAAQAEAVAIRQVAALRAEVVAVATHQEAALQVEAAEAEVTQVAALQEDHQAEADVEGNIIYVD